MIVGHRILVGSGLQGWGFGSFSSNQ
ncbi:uncharacterized protein METZ01_LOCUS348005 [marine metagenome]|uniref:Uncharacterized protein n=1 Tax=marine metagenome TaxID=408172 RepID=A0A382RF01_9ZZZZ